MYTYLGIIIDRLPKPVVDDCSVLMSYLCDITVFYFTSGKKKKILFTRKLETLESIT